MLHDRRQDSVALSKWHPLFVELATSLGTSVCNAYGDGAVACKLAELKPNSIWAGRSGSDGANLRHIPLERLGGARRLGFARGADIV